MNDFSTYARATTPQVLAGQLRPGQLLKISLASPAFPPEQKREWSQPFSVLMDASSKLIACAPDHAPDWNGRHVANPLAIQTRGRVILTKAEGGTETPPLTITALTILSPKREVPS